MLVKGATYHLKKHEYVYLFYMIPKHSNILDSWNAFTNIGRHKPGPPSQYKDCLSGYENFHYKDETIMKLRPINGSPYIGKNTSLD